MAKAHFSEDALQFLDVSFLQIGMEVELSRI